VHYKTPLENKRQEEPNAVKDAQDTPVVFSLKKSKKFIWINGRLCPIFSLITSCMEDYSSIVNLIASVLFFSLDQQRPHYLTGHPLTIPKMALSKTAIFRWKKPPALPCQRND